MKNKIYFLIIAFVLTNANLLAQQIDVNQRINDSIKWEGISKSKDSIVLKQIINELKTKDYLDKASEKLYKIREEAKYNRESKNLKTIAEWELFIKKNNNLLLGEKYSYYYNAIDTIESLIVDGIAKIGIQNRFVIPEILPASNSKISSKTAIIGKGSIPLMTDDLRKIKGINIKLICPVADGSTINIVVGSAYMETGMINFITKEDAVTFIPTYNDKDINNNVAEGAIWNNIPLIIQNGKIDTIGGVGIWKSGTDEIKVGSMYPSDGILVFNPIKVNGVEYLIPGGNAASIHRIIGTIRIGNYIFNGEKNPVYPLTFLLDSKYGYVYIRGKGKVTLPNGTVKVFN